MFFIKYRFCLSGYMIDKKLINLLISNDLYDINCFGRLKMKRCIENDYLINRLLILSGGEVRILFFVWISGVVFFIICCGFII